MLRSFVNLGSGHFILNGLNFFWYSHFYSSCLEIFSNKFVLFFLIMVFLVINISRNLSNSLRNLGNLLFLIFSKPLKEKTCKFNSLYFMFSEIFFQWSFLIPYLLSFCSTNQHWYVLSQQLLSGLTNHFYES